MPITVFAFYDAGRHAYAIQEATICWRHRSCTLQMLLKKELNGPIHWVLRISTALPTEDVHALRTLSVFHITVRLEDMDLYGTNLTLPPAVMDPKTH